MNRNMYCVQSEQKCGLSFLILFFYYYFLCVWISVHNFYAWWTKISWNWLQSAVSCHVDAENKIQVLTAQLSSSLDCVLLFPLYFLRLCYLWLPQAVAVSWLQQLDPWLLWQRKRSWMNPTVAWTVQRLLVSSWHYHIVWKLHLYDSF